MSSVAFKSCADIFDKRGDAWLTEREKKEIRGEGDPDMDRWTQATRPTKHDPKSIVSPHKAKPGTLERSSRKASAGKVISLLKQAQRKASGVA